MRVPSKWLENKVLRGSFFPARIFAVKEEMRVSGLMWRLPSPETPFYDSPHLQLR